MLRKTMKISEKSIEWSIKHLVRHSDTDLFPRPVEFGALEDMLDSAVAKLKDVDLGNYNFGPARRFIVPKDEVSYRTATQLDPLDSIFFTAIVYEYGRLIESRRVPKHEGKVFAYRFSPNSEFQLYASEPSWREFWLQCQTKAKNHSQIVYIDIADFYNQIYHHTLENQLATCGFHNQLQKWLLNLLGNVTAKISRGIPIGPHATHLLAEMSLMPVDNSLRMRGLDFCRYSDDIVIFCNDYQSARIILNNMAEILYSQQLVAQRQKTKIYTSDTFVEHCNQMLEDRPINKAEADILKILRHHAEIYMFNSAYLTCLLLN